MRLPRVQKGKVSKVEYEYIIVYIPFFFNAYPFFFKKKQKVQKTLLPKIQNLCIFHSVAGLAQLVEQLICNQ
jgi:hypothetical protein